MNINKVVCVSFVIRLKKTVQSKRGDVCVLIFKGSGRIDNAEFKPGIEITFPVLRVKEIYHLFGATADHIYRFRIRPGSLKKPRILGCIPVYIKCMKARIETGCQNWMKNERAGC